MAEKTNKGLQQELSAARARIAELEAVEAELKQIKEELTHATPHQVGKNLNTIQEAAIFKTMAENSIDAIMLGNLESYITYANRSAYTMFGYDYESKEMINLPFKALWLEEDAPFMSKTVIPQAKAGGWSGEARRQRKDGLFIDVYVAIFPLRNETGQPFGLATIIRDMTERKQAEAALQVSEAKNRALIEAIPDLLFILDRQGIFVDYKAEEGSSLIAPPEFFLGKHISEIMPPDIVEQTEACIEKAFQTGAAQRFEYQLTPPGEDTPHYYEARLSISKENQVLALIRDVTEQEQAAGERERLQRQIIEAQQQSLRDLSTPIIPIMDRIIVMPLIGSIDSLRARDITRALLSGISQHRAKVVILDVTGLPILDSGVANHLNKTIQAARLKGARTIITGVSDAVAETIIDLGIDWSSVDVHSNLQVGLIAALNSLGIRLTQ